MPRISFTPNLRRHVDCPPREAAGATVREALDAALSGDARLRGYILDERSRLRKHMTIFVDGAAILDREGLTDPVGEKSEIFVMQALSGG